MTYHHSAVFRSASNDVVIVRAPINVQNRTGVATYCRVGLIYTARLRRENRERELLDYGGLLRKSEMHTMSAEIYVIPK